MEMKATLHKTENGWICECTGTWTGYGLTPEEAWMTWAQSLRLSRQPGDVYDQTERAYRALED